MVDGRLTDPTYLDSEKNFSSVGLNNMDDSDKSVTSTIADSL